MFKRRNLKIYYSQIAIRSYPLIKIGYQVVNGEVNNITGTKCKKKQDTIKW